MGLLTLLGFGLFFLIGFIVGALVQVVENERKDKQRSIAYWRWAKAQDNIENQMAQEGWKL